MVAHARSFIALDELTPADRARAGGKAHGCARLRQAGFAVPEGLLVLSTATGADLAELLADGWFTRFSADIRFAVRSSALGEDGEAYSFAGIHETLLDVPRHEVPAAVAACRASTRGTRADAYRHANGIASETAETGVLIQPMIAAVVAGVAFSINPLTGARDEIVINASRGPAAALVDGRIDPDELRVAKDDGRVLSCRAGEGGTARPALTPAEAREIARVVALIERELGGPQDVEWCHDGAQLWIVQARPVTAGAARPDDTEWTRANFAEVLPEVASPQALAACEDMLNRGQRAYLGRLMAPEVQLGPMVRSFGGRLYFNVSQLRHIAAFGGVSPATILRSIGHVEELGPEDERRRPIGVGEWLACLPDMARLLARHLVAGTLVRRERRRVETTLARLAARDPRTLPDEEVWRVVEDLIAEAPRALQIVFMLGSVFSLEAHVRAIVERAGFSWDRLLYSHLAAGERSVSARQAFDLVALAGTARGEPRVIEWLAREPLDVGALRARLGGTEFLAELERFLATYGHRGLWESDWSLPRYSEDPAPLLRTIRAHLATGPADDESSVAGRQAREAARAWRAFLTRLPPWRRWTVAPLVRAALRRIKAYYVWRERCRFDLVRGFAVVRRWHLVLADRFVERGWLDARDDYFLLRLDEIAPVVAGTAPAEALRAIVVERTRELERGRALRMPLFMRESELGSLIRAASVTAGAPGDRQLTGLPVSAGSVEAEVVVLHDPGDVARMKRGAILVTRATDPSWTPLFTLASGVVTEIGGVLSHASTIVREYGLPALVNVKDATRRLRTGERVRLDADRGVVSRLTPSI